VINDPVLLRLGENHFWLALADSDVLLWARAIAASAGLRVEVREPDVSPLQVQGPKARDVVGALFGEQVAGLRYYRFVETGLDGIPVVVTRTGWTGEIGYEIYLRDGSRGEELWERIMEAGRPHALRPTGPCDIRRIEAGILNWGADIMLDDNVYQVGLGRLVDESKAGDYIGREALARVRRQGVTRSLVGIEIAGDPLDLNAERWPVRSDGEVVGRVTSAVWSPRLRKNIGYAMAPVAHAAIGRTLTVELPDGEERIATVVPMPFLDPGKEIPRS
jgi:aminomethyltransferase